MTDIRIERDFMVAPERLFAAVTQQADLLNWWGPEGLYVPEHALDFSKLGPWFSIMQNDEGQRYKLSGQVTSYEPPRSVGFTWAWHDDTDQRGRESHVTFSVSDADGGARLTLDHRDLSDEENATNHNHGWQSSLNKLQALLD